MWGRVSKRSSGVTVHTSTSLLFLRTAGLTGWFAPLTHRQNNPCCLPSKLFSKRPMYLFKAPCVMMLPTAYCDEDKELYICIALHEKHDQWIYALVNRRADTEWNLHSWRRIFSDFCECFLSLVLFQRCWIFSKLIYILLDLVMNRLQFKWLDIPLNCIYVQIYINQKKKKIV